LLITVALSSLFWSATCDLDADAATSPRLLALIGLSTGRTTKLATIDSLTGRATVIADISKVGAFSMETLAVDWTRGVFYTSFTAMDVKSFSAVMLDLKGNVLKNFSTPVPIFSLQVDQASGNVYAVSFTPADREEKLVQVNFVTGAITTIVDFGPQQDVEIPASVYSQSTKTYGVVVSGSGSFGAFVQQQVPKGAMSTTPWPFFTGGLSLDDANRALFATNYNLTTQRIDFTRVTETGSNVLVSYPGGNGIWARAAAAFDPESKMAFGDYSIGTTYYLVTIDTANGNKATRQSLNYMPYAFVVVPSTHAAALLE